MTSALHDDANSQILRAFGITQQNVLGADLTLRPGQLPRFTVDCLADPHTMLHEVLAFELVPRHPKPEPAPALDLDAVCAAARERLAASTAHNAEWQLYEWRAESDAIHDRMNRALRLHKAAAANAMCRLEPISQLAYDLGTAKAEALEVLIEADAAINGLHDLRSVLRERFAREYQGGI